MPDYDMLRGNTGGFPPDGIHDAYLDAARVVDTRSGESIVCDWRTPAHPLYQWTCWHRLGGPGLGFTPDFLAAIGVDRSALREVDGSRLEDALEARVGVTYEVRTKRWGADGGGGVNVEALGEQAQQSLDVPIEPVAAQPVAAGDEKDIPF